MSLIWLLAQLLFWCALMVTVVAVAVAAVLAPPYLLIRAVRHLASR